MASFVLSFVLKGGGGSLVSSSRWKTGGASTLSEINKTRGGHLSHFQKPSVHQIASNLVCFQPRDAGSMACMSRRWRATPLSLGIRFRLPSALGVASVRHRG